MEEEQKAWYDSDEDRAYDEAVNSIKAAVGRGVAFGDAAKGIDLKDQGLTASAITDALKLLIAEMHFVQKMPLDEVSRKLKLPVERLESTRTEMIREVEAAAIEKYKDSLGQKGNA